MYQWNFSSSMQSSGTQPGGILVLEISLDGLVDQLTEYTKKSITKQKSREMWEVSH